MFIHNKISPRMIGNEYKLAVPVLLKIVRTHQDSLVPGVPQLDWCDYATQVK